MAKSKKKAAKGARASKKTAKAAKQQKRGAPSSSRTRGASKTSPRSTSERTAKTSAKSAKQASRKGGASGATRGAGKAKGAAKAAAKRGAGTGAASRTAAKGTMSARPASSRGGGGRKAGGRGENAAGSKARPSDPATSTGRVDDAERMPPATRASSAGRGARKSAPTGSAASTGRRPNLDRDRRKVWEDEEEVIPSPPSSLNMDRTASAVRSGRAEYEEKLRQHTSTGPAMTGGDVDADWQDAETVGDEAPGGDNPTPDQDVVDEIGKALGIEYDDDEELRGGDELVERDKHRWELDPASKEEFEDE